MSDIRNVYLMHKDLNTRKFVGTVRQGHEAEDLRLVYKMLVYKEAHTLKDEIKAQAWSLAQQKTSVNDIIVRCCPVLSGLLANNQNQPCAVRDCLNEADSLIRNPGVTTRGLLQREHYQPSSDNNGDYDQYHVSAFHALVVRAAG